MITKTLSILYGRLGLLCAIAAILLFALWSAPDVHAQCRGDRDCDGVPDSDDACQDVAGPADNRGCPYPDSDGDGLPDSVDHCPNEAGPRDNGGCPLPPPPPPDSPPPAPGGDPAVVPLPDPGAADPPEPEVPAEPPVLLPYMPEDGPCVVATQGVEGVNVRLLPDTAFGIIIVNTLDSQLLYPVVMSVETPEGVWWLLKQGGFVAGWVTRQGGDCSLLPAIQLALAEDHFVFEGHALLDSGQPGYLPLLVFFDKTGAVKEAWFVGFQSNPNEDSAFPPGQDVSTNPSNDKQPPPFFLMLSAHEGNPPNDGEPTPDDGIPSGDEVGFIIYGMPSGDEAGFVINWIPSGDEAGFVVNWIPSGDEAGFVIDWTPSGDEAGIIINDLPSPDEVGMIIDGGMPSGDEAGFIIDWLIGDGSVVPGGESAFCDGSVMPGDGTLRPTESLMGDGSVMPGEVGVYLCDGSVVPSPDEAGIIDDGKLPSDEAGIIDDGKQPSWLLPAMVFPGGGGEELGCSNNLLPLSDTQLGGPDTSPAATCMFTNGELIALCDVSSEEAFCMYSEF